MMLSYIEYVRRVCADYQMWIGGAGDATEREEYILAQLCQYCRELWTQVRVST